MPRRALRALSAAGLVVAAAATAFAIGAASDRSIFVDRAAKPAAGDPDAIAGARQGLGEGPVGGWEAYKAASRTYPADVISPAVVETARTTFDKIGKAGSS